MIGSSLVLKKIESALAVLFLVMFLWADHVQYRLERKTCMNSGWKPLLLIFVGMLMGYKKNLN